MVESEICESCGRGDHEFCEGEPTILEGGWENCCCNAEDPCPEDEDTEPCAECGFPCAPDPLDPPLCGACSTAD
jgi:hypothetical protein